MMLCLYRSFHPLVTVIVRHSSTHVLHRTLDTHRQKKQQLFVSERARLHNSLAGSPRNTRLFIVHQTQGPCVPLKSRPRVVWNVDIILMIGCSRRAAYHPCVPIEQPTHPLPSPFPLILETRRPSQIENGVASTVLLVDN